jgi:hemoglobin
MPRKPEIDLYQAIGGREGCRRLSEAFYARVALDPALRPLFPGKSMRCAIEAFAAFLAQFLGGPAADAQARWSLSLRESHRRFRIGPREREAWMANMREALGETAIEEPVRAALYALFEHSSAYILNRGESADEPPAPESSNGGIDRELGRRWEEQRALDDLVAALEEWDGARAAALAQGPALKRRFARDRAVFAHALGLMIASRNGALLEYAERELRADPALVQARNRHGRSLLHDAAAYGSMRMVELLLELGADPNGAPAGGHPPLYCAANQRMAGGGDVVRILVRAGAEVDARSVSKRCTALHMAARRGNVEIAEALLDCGADISARDTGGDTPLQRAKNCRKAGVVSLLVSRGAE